MVGKAKILKLRVDTFGHYLGMDKGCIVLRDKEKRVQEFPLSECEVGEVVLTSGNTVSVDALAMLTIWGIDILITTHSGKPLAILKNLADDSHVNTRISQYESLSNGKGIAVAKQILTSKLLSQNLLLRKYSLRQLDVLGVKAKIEELDVNLELLRKKLNNIEGHFTRRYFDQVFQLFPIATDRRKGFQAYDGINNLFNLAYEQLFAKCYLALSKAHLEANLGYVHTLKWSRPSLVCDFMELYRYLIDDYLIRFSRGLGYGDFRAVTCDIEGKKCKRMFLKRKVLLCFLNGLYGYFGSKVCVPRHQRGTKQEFESLITEEANLLARYLRGERDSWIPRIPQLS